MISTSTISRVGTLRKNPQKFPNFSEAFNMGWDSDSDDAVDIDAQLAAKNAAKKTYETLNCLIYKHIVVSSTTRRKLLRRLPQRLNQSLRLPRLLFPALVRSRP
jgi:hypothetical protein